MNKHTKYIGIYSCLFCGIVIVAFGPFLENGKVVIWDTDAIGQYYPTFLYIGQWIREMLSNILHRNFNIRLFDMQIGMGEDVIGCLNYYGFGDPLNILAVFANKTTGQYIFTAMFFLRIYLSGLAFYYYSIKINVNKALISIGALSYAFSGFAIAGGGRYIGFLSPMIYFPLMLAGCEDKFRKRKSKIMMLSVAYASLCNFYFLYMTSLFLAVYCTMRLLFIYGLKDIKIIAKTIVQCLYRYILGVLLAAPVLIPSIMAFLSSNRTELDVCEILFDVHNWIPDIELLKCFLTGYRFNSETVYWSGVPVMELLLIFMSVFFIKTKRDRQCILAVFLGILAWMMPITSYIASAFGNYYTRWVFMLQFLLCIVMICTLQNILARIKNVRIEHITLSIVGIAVVLNISLINYKMISLDGGGWIQVFVTSQEARKYVDSPKNDSTVINEDEGLYRISNDQLYDINQRPDNSAMLNDYNGLNFWFSIVNGNTQRMINQLCTYDVNNWRSYGMNNSAIYETLVGVRYHISKDDDAPQGYVLAENIDFDGESWKVYKNNNYLPLAYTYSDTISLNYS